MTTTDFTDHEEVRAILKSVLPSLRRRHFSDIVDAEGHQYVDLVMEGGGVLGIALVGYTYMLEQAGIRFLRIGGTSAGSINALLLAGLDIPENPKAGLILEALANLDMFSLVDGSRSVQGLIRAFIAKKTAWVLIPRGLLVLPHLCNFLGLNPGDELLRWLTGVLRDHGIQTTRDLRQRMRTPPKGIHLRKGKTLSTKDLDSYLALVSADVTTETKVDFPRMAPLYMDNFLDENPALFVRASMSIPFFFSPLQIRNIPRGAGAAGNWNTLAAYDGEIPVTAMLVDGGIMSNFPIDLFHSPATVPEAPTFGAKLGSAHRASHDITSIPGLGGAVFDSARHCLDYDFIARHPDYKHLVTQIDTADHNWIDFFMPDAAKVDLFVRGVAAAANFLKKFQWGRYKGIRKNLARAYSQGKKFP